MPVPFTTVLNEHRARDLPFVAYRKPGENALKVCLQKNHRVHTVQTFDESGFIFAPFDSSKDPLLLIPDELLRFSQPSSPATALADATAPMEDPKKKQAFESLVQKAINRIIQGSFRKLVVSRSIAVEIAQSPLEIFGLLLDLYPKAFCYLWYHPETGFWMGASPERLLHARDKIFETMSLAGTLQYEEGEVPHWSRKEKTEQELVTRYIREVLEEQGAQFETAGPRAVRAGNLWHLQTTIRGKLAKSGIADLLRALHPTPAVCGIPKAESYEFLIKHEGYDRGFYTGYLGELNLEDQYSEAKALECNLYVNLRCMSFSGNCARIYVGGGVTADSIPADEYRETTYKAATMARLLLNSEE